MCNYFFTAISQVQGWLDELHLKRQVLEGTFNRRKTQLEQCLALAILAADLRELEDAVHKKRDLLANSNQLGKSFYIIIFFLNCCIFFIVIKSKILQN